MTSRLLLLNQSIFLIFGNELACMATNLEKDKMADGVELIETVQAKEACGTTMASNGLSVEDISEDTKKAAEEVKEKANECFKSKFDLRYTWVSGWPWHSIDSYIRENNLTKTQKC